VRLAEAKAAAAVLVNALALFCERIEVAGSIRRNKPEVKDVEIVCVPKVVQRPSRQATLFGAGGTEDENLVDGVVADWLREGGAKPRLGKDNKAAIGSSYKRLLVQVRGTWMALDLFSVLPPRQWGLIYLIRTGSGVGPSGQAYDGFGPAMLARWKSVSGGGYSKNGCLHEADGRPVPTPEEDDVFRVCRVVWVPPEERTSAAAVKESLC